MRRKERFSLLKKERIFTYRKMAVLLTALPVVIIAGYMIGKTAFIDGPPRRAAEAYICALASGDVAEARAVSTGKAAEAAGKLEGKNLAARVDDISASVQALGRGWAKVKATVELTLADGTADVGWYEIDVIKEAGEWKVVSFREDTPDFSGWSLVWGRAGDVETAREVFAGYLNALAAGKWDEAVKYLAGPARKNMEASQEVLGKGEVISKVKNLREKLVWAQDKEMAIEFSYEVDNRAARVTVELYRTRQGWKIITLR